MTDLYVTGNNDSYALGLGDTADRTAFTQLAGDWLTVARLTAFAGTNDGWRAAIKVDGTLWVWGNNAWEQLGLGDTTTRTAPTQVGSATWSAVACGHAHLLAIKSDGTLWGCGRNDYKQAGAASGSTVSTLTQMGSDTDWVEVFAGVRTSYALNSAGELWAWGENDYYGHCGQGAASPVSYTFASAVQVPGAWERVAPGEHYVVAIKTDGSLWAWGNNANSQLGQGDTTLRTSPTQIGSATNWVEVGCGAFAAYAINSAGELWGWGAGFDYTFGDGTTSNRTTPAQIGSATNWARVDGVTRGTLAVNAAAECWVAGKSSDGRLGTATNPVQNLTNLSLAFPAGLIAVGPDSAMLLQGVSVAVGASAPIRVTVTAPTGAAAAPIHVAVSTTGNAEASIQVGVVDADTTTTWTLRVVLAGNDVSSRLTGVLRVRAEEDAARLAEFTLLPTSGPVDPIEWTGAPVTLACGRTIAGVTVYYRLFTGKVDVAEYDPMTCKVRYLCTDDLHNVVAALSKANIDAIVGGLYSRGAQGEIDEHWDYAQGRLDSVPGSLDANAWGGPRVSLWDGLPVWRTYTDAHVLDRSVSVTLPRRKDLVNQIDIVYQYRFHRLRERRASLAFSASIIGTQAYARGYALPSQGEIESAINGAGWKVLSSSFQEGYAYVKIGDPAGAPAGGPGDWWIVTGGGVSNASARVAQRHAQPITEEYAITVTASDSIAAHGSIAKPLRGALASEWNPAAWEQDWTLTPDTSSTSVDHSPDAPRAESDDTIQTLIAMARRQILASHRTARVRWALACRPDLDLDRAVAIDTATVEASGKVAEFEHEFDIDAGTAITTLAIASSGVAAGGLAVSTPATVPTPPDADAAAGTDDWPSGLPDFGVHVGGMVGSNYNENLMGFLVNAPRFLTAHNFTLDQDFSFENPYWSQPPSSGKVQRSYDFPVTGFRARLPGVATSHRAALVMDKSGSYDTAIPEDPFTLSA